MIIIQDGKVAVRNIRRESVDKIKAAEKDKDIGKDDSKGFQVCSHFSLFFLPYSSSYFLTLLLTFSLFFLLTHSSSYLLPHLLISYPSCTQSFLLVVFDMYLHAYDCVYDIKKY